MAAPAQSYSILFSAYLSPLGATVPAGYAVTKAADGKSFVVATTANLAASSSGTIDGIALVLGNPGETIQIQEDATVEPSVCPWLGTGAIESAVVDANGKVQRASVAAGIVIGSVTKDGAVKLQQSGAIVTSLAGDAVGSALANTVVAIRNATIPALAGNIGKALVLSALGAFAFAALATSGYDTADHVGGGQEVVAATGAAGVFNVRGATVATFGNAPAASGEAIRLGAPSATWTIARRNGQGTNDVMLLGGFTDGLGTEEIYIGSAATGTPNTLVKVSSSARFQVKTGAAAVCNPALDVTSTVAQFGPADAAGMPLAFGTVPSATGTVRFPAATDATGYSLLKVRNAVNTGDRNAVAMYLSDGATLTAFRFGDSVSTTELRLYNNQVDLLSQGTGTTMVSVTPTVATFGPAVAAGIPIAFGTTPSTSGNQLRMPSAFDVRFRNAVNSADRIILAADASDGAFFGDVGSVGLPAVVMGTPVFVFSTGPTVLQATINTSGLTLAALAGTGTRIVNASAAGLLGSVASVPVANGGTGLTSSGANGNVLTSNGSAWVSQAPAATGPGGSNTQLQYNNGGAFGGMAEFTYASSKLSVSTSGSIAVGTNPASAGYFRVENPSAYYLQTRNASNTGNLHILGGAGNDVYVGDYDNTALYLSSLTTIVLYCNAVAGLSTTTTTATLGSSSGIATAKMSVATGGSCQLAINASAVLTVAAACTSVQTTNLALGALSPTFNSATNTIYVADGTAPSAAPSAGFYLQSDSGRLRIRSSATGGTAMNLILDSVYTKTGSGATYCIKVIVDTPGGSAQTKWLQLFDTA